MKEYVPDSEYPILRGIESTCLAAKLLDSIPSIQDFMQSRFETPDAYIFIIHRFCNFIRNPLNVFNVIVDPILSQILGMAIEQKSRYFVRHIEILFQHVTKSNLTSIDKPCSMKYIKNHLGLGTIGHLVVRSCNPFGALQG